jgi:hypothetical protein
MNPQRGGDYSWRFMSLLLVFPLFNWIVDVDTVGKQRDDQAILTGL